ncbi:MAG: GcrA family cell cycle regulator [Chelatococcus sp.]|uniref:GcrA family cell cycle regulator n=1 Tax=Chelatococcus sp. TaxID=1953771 RepID=UPI002632D56A|nr:GcrA family cell cycle regulator [Chelatococcus sp.]MCO5079211.1 GcrA family cell cycle regulator [Chelatococcus sp.]
MNIHTTEFDGTGTNWAKEDVETLVAMTLAGQSASKIAALLGKTKNSVIGKKTRLENKGLLPKGVTAINQSRARNAEAQPKKARRPTRVKIVPATIEYQPAPQSGPSTAYVPGIPMEDVMGKNGRCKFGLWGVKDYPALEIKLVCGLPSIPGKPWCRHCYTLVYSPREQSARRRAA